MKKFIKVNVSEQELEELVRRNTEMIEEGLLFVDHQKTTTGGRLDVILVDSGKSLVLAELKVVQDDGMLLQGLDYYDYVSSQIEAFARLYKKHNINPTQQLRLFLIAPSFSQTLINRCKWLDLPISLFTYNCGKFQGEDDVIAIFNEQQITPPVEVVEITDFEDHLNYITDLSVRTKASDLLDEIKNWNPVRISTDSIKYNISMKVDNHVFACFGARRKHFFISTYDEKDDWKTFPVKTDGDLASVKSTIKAAMERRIR